MMKKTLYILLGICLLCSCGNSTRSTIVISHTTNGSMGENWEYELSNNTVLQEVGHSSASLFPLFGTKDEWTFKAIASGEVTIYWTAYESGNEIVEDECYSVTYIVDDKLNITIK